MNFKCKCSDNITRMLLRSPTPWATCLLAAPMSFMARFTILRGSSKTPMFEVPNFEINKSVRKTSKAAIKSEAGIKDQEHYKVSPSEDLLEMEYKYAPDWSLKTPKRNWKRTKIHMQGFKPKGEMLFGYHPVLVALQNKRREFHSIFLREMVSLGERLKLIQQLAEEEEIPLQFVDGPTLDTICQRPVHQGICADVSCMKRLEFTDSINIQQDSSLLDQEGHIPPLWLILDNVHDPMNFGAILRCSYYFGVSKVFSTFTNCCKLSPVVSKASAGVMEMMDIYSIGDLQFFLKAHKENGWQVIGSSCSKSFLPVQDLRNFRLERPTILLLGNEGSGVEQELLSICDNLISILPFQPLHPEIDSLNVSVATGVILYHLLSKPKL